MTCRETEPWPSTELDWLHAHDRQWTALHNRLHRNRQPWTGEFAGQPITIQWTGVVKPTEPLLDVHVQWGSAMCVLQLPVQALELLGLGHYSVPDLNGLAGSMLLELALLPFIEPLEQLTGQPLQVCELTGTTQANSAVLSLMLEVQIAQGPASVIPLHLSGEAAGRVAELLDQHTTPAAHSLAAVRLPLTVERGQAQLSLAELRSLRPGDVLMLDESPADQVRLVLDDRLQARAELNGDTLKLLEPPIALNPSKEPPMTQTAIGANLDTTLDELPLKLVCQVGSVELSLAQLRELGAGSLVQLSPQLHDGVDLMVNGRRVGQGQLVKIGDGLGVRLLSFATA